jgi:formate--tetrahydrofolate ligase
VSRQALDKNGYENLAKHIENIRIFGVPLVIAVNKKKNDPANEIAYIIKQCSGFGVDCVVSEVWGKGGEGGEELGDQVIRVAGKLGRFKFLYKLEESLQDKIEKIAVKIYGAEGVNWTEEARADLKLLEDIGMGNVPVCIAKTQYSLSDDPKVAGRPKNFRITVRELKPSAGAGFVVAFTGAIMTMPGLPKHPAAENMDITESGKIIGLF